MRKLITLSISLVILTLGAFGQTSMRVLFIGNSYTDVNNLPQMVTDLATSAGDNLTVDRNTPGGQTFKGHSTNGVSLSKIMQGNWDVVVLQEQSQLPSFPIGQVEAEVFPYAYYLDSLIRTYNACSETMFYMTWGRKNGDASNCASFPPVCTYEGMDSLLNLRYMMMAESNHAVVSPVGAVWKYLRQNHPHIELYQADESHPSLAGSYAAACCFYTTLFRKDPLTITNDYTLPTADAATIRLAVKTIVYDSLLNWHIGEYDPIANFSFVPPINSVVTFKNLSKNATSYEWNFGDGNTSTETNPTHTYPMCGNYTVTLSANYCTYSNTMSQSVQLNTDGTENYQMQNNIILYPNPISNELMIEMEGNNKIVNFEILTAIGQVIFKGNFIDKTTVQTNNFTPGMYLVKIENGKTFEFRKIIKE